MLFKGVGEIWLQWELLLMETNLVFFYTNYALLILSEAILTRNEGPENFFYMAIFKEIIVLYLLIKCSSRDSNSWFKSNSGKSNCVMQPT